MVSQIDADLRNRIPSLVRMARRWEARGGTPKEEWELDARVHLADVPGLQALEWVDKTFHVRWVVPQEGNQKALDLNLAAEEKGRIALEKAKDIRIPTVTAPIDLVQGGKGFLIYVPIYTRGEFDGFILAAFRIEEWLQHVLGIRDGQFETENFRIAVFFDDVPVYRGEGWDPVRDSGIDAVAQTNLVDHRLSIHLRPTESYIARNITSLPKLTALFGALLSVLVTFTVYLLQRAFAESWAAREAKSALEVEIRERRRAEDKLQDALARLDLATKAGGIGVWAWNVSTGLLSWNERMYDLYDIPGDVTPTYEHWRSAVHPDDLPRVEALLKKAVEGKAVFSTEFRILLTVGTVRYLGAKARLERNQAGTPQLVTGISWDITDLKKTEETLRNSEERVRLLLNSTAEAIYGLDLNGDCTFANPSCLRMLGYATLEQLLGRNMHRLIHHSRADGSPMPAEECSICRALREGRGVHRDSEVLWRADGTSFPAEYWSHPQKVGGRVSGAVVTFVDITERKRSEEMLTAERQRLSSILEGINVGTWEWNVETGETVYNERWAAIIGYTLAELAPVSIDTWIRFVHPEDLRASNDLLQKHFRKESPYYECETRMRHRNGNWIWVLDRGKVAKWTDDEKPLIMLGTHQDITERKLAEERIRHMATHDMLTDLPSLRLADDRLSMALSLARRNKAMAAIMFVDLDCFKAINDTIGHEAGDYALKQVARRLRACVRDADTVARVGGDEFLLIAAGIISSQDAAVIAEKVLRSLSRPVFFNGQEMVVGASIGIALYPDHGDSKDRLIRLADEAMYRAKNSGKNSYSFATPLDSP